MITEYKILHSHDIFLLEDQVRGYIQEGWQPFGSFAVKEHDIQYFQVVVKEE